VLQLVAG